LDKSMNVILNITQFLIYNSHRKNKYAIKTIVLLKKIIKLSHGHDCNFTKQLSEKSNLKKYFF